MRKELAVISSPEFGEIRSVMVNGEPLFVAKDVCLILGIRQHRDAIAIQKLYLIDAYQQKFVMPFLFPVYLLLNIRCAINFLPFL